MQNKITERNYPLFKYLKWSDSLLLHPDFKKCRNEAASYKSGNLPFLDFTSAEFVSSFAGNSIPFDIRRIVMTDWAEAAKVFSSSVEILSETFMSAFRKAAESFLTVELMKEVIGEFKGTLVFPGGKAICYYFHFNDARMGDDGELRYKLRGSLIAFSADGNHPDVIIAGDQAYLASEARMTDRKDADVSCLFEVVILYHLFKKYADVEVLEAKSAKRSQAGFPTVQTTLRNVRFMDASFYRTIVRSEGFTVRGHFRLQPCGVGRQDKKLIYINEFQKHGYTRRAKILIDSLA